jgi:hypothetical protein
MEPIFGKRPSWGFFNTIRPRRTLDLASKRNGSDKQSIAENQKNDYTRPMNNSALPSVWSRSQARVVALLCRKRAPEKNFSPDAV